MRVVEFSYDFVIKESLFINLWLWLPFDKIIIHIKHHSTRENIQNPKFLILGAFKKINFLKIIFWQLKKILNSEKKSLLTLFFYFEFRILWDKCAHCSISRVWDIVNICILIYKTLKLSARISLLTWQHPCIAKKMRNQKQNRNVIGRKFSNSIFF